MALTRQVSASKTVVTRAVNYIKQKTQGRFVERSHGAECAKCVWTKKTSNSKVKAKDEVQRN